MTFLKTTCGLKLSIIILTTLFSFSVNAWDGDQIDNDEKVVFFSSYGYFNSLDGNCILTIQGHIFEPSTSLVKRSTVISGFEAYAGSTIQDKDEFWSRIRPLVSDNERGEKIIVKLGEKTYNLPQSDAGGRMTAKLALSENGPLPRLRADWRYRHTQGRRVRRDRAGDLQDGIDAPC